VLLCVGVMVTLTGRLLKLGKGGGSFVYDVYCPLTRGAVDGGGVCVTDNGNDCCNCSDCVDDDDDDEGTLTKWRS
jgi:hypothetical protein